MRNIRCSVLVASWLAFAACQNLPPEVHATIVPSQDLLRANPSDIAILPIEDATPQRSASPRVAGIRLAIASALVQRRYAPLNAAMVDRVIGAAPASGGTVLDPGWIEQIAGRCEEDALLAVRLTRWDESSLMNTGRVRFQAEVRLFDADTRKSLWAGGLEGEVKAGGMSGPAPLERQARAGDAAMRFATELIRRLPPRATN